MLMNRIIPCLDVRAGRVVKGVQFKGLRDVGDPGQLACRYDLAGADELCMLDVSATLEERDASLQTVRDIRQRLRIPLTVGGGVADLDSAERLLLAGADKVAVNTAAVRRPALLTEIALRYGRQCVVCAIDAAKRQDAEGWEVVIRSGNERTGLDAIEWAQRAVQAGAGEILLTSFDQDGKRSGYDLALLRAVCSAVDVPVIASGGAASAQHMADALETGATAVLAASILHDGETTVCELKKQLDALGAGVRL